jgi:hypothetical protein
MADKITLNVSYECPKGLVLIDTTGDKEPGRPPFCIQAYETTQEEYEAGFRCVAPAVAVTTKKDVQDVKNVKDVKKVKEVKDPWNNW